MKSAFQKASVITVAVVTLALVSAAAGTASADEPGWQSPVAGVGETLIDVLGEPGWQNPPADSSE